MATLDSDQDIAVTYPPNSELDVHEREALRGLKLNDFAKSALLKLVRSAASYPVFHLLTVADGVGDPVRRCDGEELYQGTWNGITLASKEPGDDTMMHDQFYDSYWDFKNKRRS